MEVGVKTYRSVSLDEEKLEKPLEGLLFHQCCGSLVDVINNGLTARRINDLDDYSNGVVLTSRRLRKNELFEVRLDKIVTKWIGSIEIGATTHSPIQLAFPYYCTFWPDTWIMTGHGVMHNGIAFIHHYGQNLDKLKVGDRVGVMKNDSSILHFYVNGEDQGNVITVAKRVYGLINLYGQAVQVTIVEDKNYHNLRFHHLHGNNAKITNKELKDYRARALEIFNDAVVIGNRTLEDDEIFRVSIDKMIEDDRRYNAIEVGVTTIKPKNLIFPSTMTDVDHETWMLSGSSFMRDGITLNNNYSLDLDEVTEGNYIGIMRCSDKSLNYYLDGVQKGVACKKLPVDGYPTIDLYGQCVQVTIILPDCEQKETMIQQYSLEENISNQQSTSMIETWNQASIPQQKEIANTFLNKGLQIQGSLEPIMNPITQITNDKGKAVPMQPKSALVEDFWDSKFPKNHARNTELIKTNPLKIDRYTNIEIKPQMNNKEFKQVGNVEAIHGLELESQITNGSTDDSCLINCIYFIYQCCQCTIL